jgi:hypothetical protein
LPYFGTALPFLPWESLSCLSFPSVEVFALPSLMALPCFACRPCLSFPGGLALLYIIMHFREDILCLALPGNLDSPCLSFTGSLALSCCLGALPCLDVFLCLNGGPSFVLLCLALPGCISLPARLALPCLEALLCIALTCLEAMPFVGLLECIGFPYLSLRG